MRFKGQSALITGAASGIGRATALRLLAEDCMVACLDVDENGLRTLAAEFDRLSGNADATRSADEESRLITVKGSIAAAEDVERFVWLAKKFIR